jgi:hypothetical protein
MTFLLSRPSLLQKSVAKPCTIGLYKPEMSMAALPLPLPLPRWRWRRGSGSLFFVTVAARRGSGSFFFITVAERRGSGSFQKKKILKTREFTQNSHFKERYTVKLDEFHRLEAIALV